MRTKVINFICVRVALWATMTVCMSFGRGSVCAYDYQSVGSAAFWAVKGRFSKCSCFFLECRSVFSAGHNDEFSFVSAWEYCRSVLSEKRAHRRSEALSKLCASQRSAQTIKRGSADSGAF